MPPLEHSKHSDAKTEPEPRRMGLARGRALAGAPRSGKGGTRGQGQGAGLARAWRKVSPDAERGRCVRVGLRACRGAGGGAGQVPWGCLLVRLRTLVDGTSEGAALALVLLVSNDRHVIAYMSMHPPVLLSGTRVLDHHRGDARQRVSHITLLGTTQSTSTRRTPHSHSPASFRPCRRTHPQSPTPHRPPPT